jgi:septal ring factor EnvC (AmiA/AmiB activator)
MFTCFAAALVAAAPAPIPAAALSAQVEAQAQALAAVEAPTVTFMDDLSAFSARAQELSDALRAAQVSDDLPCIFHGISEDARTRATELAAAPDAAARQRAMEGLRVLLNDAALLAPIAGHELIARATAGE